MLKLVSFLKVLNKRPVLK